MSRASRTSFAAALRADYEATMARTLSTARAYAFANGRTALACILRGAGLGSGDEVLLSPLTCKVVPLTLLSLGLVPVFVDISAATLNLDANAIAPAVGPRTRVVLFQHTYGSPEGLDEVGPAAASRNLLLVEDRAHCLPLPRPTAKAGGSLASIFSNNLLKPLPAGSGGLAVTDDSTLARAMDALCDEYPSPAPAGDRRLKVAAWVHDHVLSPGLYWPMLTFYARFDTSYQPRPIVEEIATEVTSVAHRAGSYQVRRGLDSLVRLDGIATTRRLHSAEYARALVDIGGVAVPPIDVTLPLYYFPVRLQQKSALLERARRRRIEVIAWPGKTPIYPIDDAGRLQAYGYTRGSCPVAEQVASELVGLPTHPGITPHHRDQIVNLLRGHAA